MAAIIQSEFIPSGLPSNNIKKIYGKANFASFYMVEQLAIPQ